MPRMPRLAPLTMQYAVAAGASALALLANLVLASLVTPVSPLFLAAVMVSAWYGGFGPGLTATWLCGLASLHFFQPAGASLLDFSAGTALRLGAFLLAALIISSLNAQRRRATGELAARLRQQDGVAALGQEALYGGDAAALMDRATALVAGALEVEYAKVLELLPDGQALLLRAGVGWREGLVGRATVGTGQDSQAGYTLASAEPVIVADLRAERRFSGPPLLHDHGVVSGLSVVIPGAERPFGVLGAHTARRRTFTRQDVHFLQAVANVLAAALARFSAEDALRASNQQLRLIVEQLPVTVWTTDTDLRITSYAHDPHGTESSVPRGLVGRTIAELSGRTEVDFPPVAVHQRALRGETIAHEGVWQDRSFAAIVRPLADPDGRIIGCIGMAQDITERRRMEEERSRLAAIVESSSDAIIGKTLDGVIISWNAAAERLYGYRAAEAVGQPVSILFPLERLSELGDITERLRRGEAIDHLETVRLRKDHSRMDVSVSISPVRDGAGRIVGAASIARDITERKLAEAALEHRALYDALTELPNRTLLRDRLQQALRLAPRQPTQVGLFVMDLDHFKEVNDTFGHPAGDALLLQVGARLRKALRDSDTVGRLGGDEFAVVLPSVTGPDEALAVAARIHAALEAPFMVEHVQLTARASLGIAVAPEHGDDADLLLRRADIAMYVAKRAGGGSAVYTADQDLHRPSRLALLAELRQALDRNQFTLHYQPQVDARRETVEQVEALVRWRHPQRGLLAPGLFLDMVEQAGLMHHLTLWVIETAALQIAEWRQQGIRLRVAVNLSALDLQNHDLPAKVAALLDRWSVPPEMLKVELTESSLMTDPERAMAVLRELHRRGVGVSIDDFGTGYSSMLYLRQLPADELKIDREFILHVQESASDATIVRSVIELGHNLGLRVVAEGVEQAETWDLLTAWGCDAIQGYYLSQPLEAADLAAWLRAWESAHAAAP